jgi:glycopeptide antibiotics resistance protein
MVPNWAKFLSEPNGWNIDIRPFNPLALLILLFPLYLLQRRGKSTGWLISFALFFLYLWAVFAYAVCPLPIEASTVAWLRETQSWQHNVNLAPRILVRLSAYWNDVELYGNVLLGAPFGFGLPFLVAPRWRAPRPVLAMSFAFAAGIELIQLGIGAVFYGFPYRSIDIEDVVLVFAGTVAGHGLLRLLASVYWHLVGPCGARVPAWNHFHAVLGTVSPRDVLFVAPRDPEAPRGKPRLRVAAPEAKPSVSGPDAAAEAEAEADDPPPEAPAEKKRVP